MRKTEKKKPLVQVLNRTLTVDPASAAANDVHDGDLIVVRTEQGEDVLAVVEIASHAKPVKRISKRRRRP